MARLDSAIDDLRYDLSKINQLESYIGEQGRKHIWRELNSQRDPYKVVIPQIQEELGLRFVRCSPAINFLDVLKLRRSEIFFSLLENVKAKLDAQVQQLDESSLLKLLSETTRLMGVKELKSIPISVIKKVQDIPEATLKELAKRNYLTELPLAVRRQAWKVDHRAFIISINDNCKSCLQIDEKSPRQGNAALKQLCDSIGSGNLAEDLFTVFADYCSKQHPKADDSPAWGNVIYYVLMAMHTSNRKIASLGKINDLAWTIDACNRTTVDEDKLAEIVGLMRWLIVAQRDSLKSEGAALGLPGFVPAAAASTTAAAAATQKRPVQKVSQPGEKVDPVQPQRHRRQAAISLNTEKPEIVKRTENPVKQPLKIEKPQVDRDEGKRGSVRHVSDKILMEIQFAQKYLKVVMIPAWKVLSENDIEGVFTDEVTEDMAPGYHKEIENPMDLTKILKNVRSGRYDTFAAFDADVVLMFNNCIQFNGKNDYYGKYAVRLKNNWERTARAVYLQELKAAYVACDGQVTADIDARPIAAYDVPQPVIDRVVREGLSHMTRSMESLQALAAFMDKVTDDIAPGYSKEIKNPMFIKRIEKKMASKLYSTLEAFDQDMTLMFKNCIKYNKSNSEFGKLAQKLLNMWFAHLVVLEDRIIELAPPPPPEEDDEVVVAAVAAAAATTSAVTVAATGVDSAVTFVAKSAISSAAKSVVSSSVSSYDGSSAVDTSAVNASPPSVASSGADIPAPLVATLAIIPLELDAAASDKERLRTVISHACDLLVDIDSTGLFAAPNTSPQFQKMIKNPVDLSFMRVKIKKYKKLEDFDADVQQMVDNCQLFYKTTDINKVQLGLRLLAEWRHQHSYLKAVISTKGPVDLASFALPPTQIETVFVPEVPMAGVREGTSVSVSTQPEKHPRSPSVENSAVADGEEGDCAPLPPKKKRTDDDSSTAATAAFPIGIGSGTGSAAAVPQVQTPAGKITEAQQQPASAVASSQMNVDVATEDMKCVNNAAGEPMAQLLAASSAPQGDARGETAVADQEVATGSATISSDIANTGDVGVSVTQPMDVGCGQNAAESPARAEAGSSGSISIDVSVANTTESSVPILVKGEGTTSPRGRAETKEPPEVLRARARANHIKYFWQTTERAAVAVAGAMASVSRSAQTAASGSGGGSRGGSLMQRMNAAPALHPNALETLPEIVADGKLRWALAMLRGPNLQRLFRSLLAKQLRVLVSDKTRQSKERPHEYHARGLMLPTEDRVATLALQFIQLSLIPREGQWQMFYRILAIDAILLRLCLPMILLEILQKPFGSGLAAVASGEIGTATTAEQVAAYAKELVDRVLTVELMTLLSKYDPSRLAECLAEIVEQVVR